MTDKLLGARGLVLSGGGVLGVAHVGALKELNDLNNFIFDYYAGSSIGAVIATGLSMDASYEFIERLVKNLDFKNFMDDTKYDANIFDFVRLIRKLGWYKGYNIEEFYKGFIRDLCGNAEITLLEAYNQFNKFLLITTFRTNDGVTVELTKDYYPNLPIYKALMYTTAYPGFFATEVVTREDILQYSGGQYDPGCGVIFSDGGVLNNYPVNLLAKYTPLDTIIGLYLCNDTKLINDGCNLNATVSLPPPPNSVISFAISILNAISLQSNSIHIKSDVWLQTIAIDVGDINSLNFNITQDQKNKLFLSGQTAVKNFVFEFPFEL